MFVRYNKSMLDIVLLLFLILVAIQSILYIVANLNMLSCPVDCALQMPSQLSISYLRNYFTFQDNLDGEVLDESDQPVTLAFVEARSISGKLLGRTLTNNLGEFRFKIKRQKIYLSAVKFGYESLIRDLKVNLNLPKETITLKLHRVNQVKRNPLIVDYIKINRKFWLVILVYGLVSLLAFLYFQGLSYNFFVIFIIDLFIIYFLSTLRYEMEVRNSDNEPIKNYDIKIFDDKNRRISILHTDKHGRASALISPGFYAFVVGNDRKTIRINSRAVINFKFII